MALHERIAPERGIEKDIQMLKINIVIAPGIRREHSSSLIIHLNASKQAPITKNQTVVQQKHAMPIRPLTSCTH